MDPVFLVAGSNIAQNYMVWHVIFIIFISCSIWKLFAIADENVKIICATPYNSVLDLPHLIKWIDSFSVCEKKYKPIGIRRYNKGHMFKFLLRLTRNMGECVGCQNATK